MTKIKLKIKKNGGFVILFAATLSSILLAIALGVSNIALKEIKFGTSVKDTNDAFFAADTGIEYMLFDDKPPSSPYVPDAGTNQTWNTVITGLGSTGNSCAKVSIVKDNTNPPETETTIISKGYNIGDENCDSNNPDRIERELKVTY